MRCRKGQKEKRREAKRTKLRILVPKSNGGTSKKRVTFPIERQHQTKSDPDLVAIPHPASEPSSNGGTGLLQLPPETRMNIYKFLEEPADLQLILDGEERKAKDQSRRVRCLSSHQFPQLGTCRLMRKESLAYLLSVTQLTLKNGVRPRVRQDPRQHGLPLWQLCNIQHVSIDISRKMQFEFFGRLKTLTLLWPTKPLDIRAPNTWRSGLVAYLWSDIGAASMTELAMAEVKTSSHRWIQKLAKRKKKRFRLQMKAVFGCRDHSGGKSNSVVVSVLALKDCAD